MSTNIKVAIVELHKAFYKLNEVLFNNELPEPAILIQNKGNKKNVLGWCSTREIWKNEKTNEKKYEINLVAEYMNRPLYEIIATLLHEMVHLYNLVNNIQDVSRNGTYHNKKFKEASEKFGLIVKHDKMIGWSITTLHEKTKKLIDSFNINESAFNIFRIDIFSLDEEDPEGTKNGKRKSSSRKYVCNSCGAIVRATKELSIICGKCKQEFELEE